MLVLPFLFVTFFFFIIQEKPKGESWASFQHLLRFYLIVCTWCRGRKLALARMLVWRLETFIVTLLPQAEIILWWNCVLVLQKSEVWAPGTVRNPEAYILKDQVFSQKKSSLFERSGLFSSQFFVNSFFGWTTFWTRPVCCACQLHLLFEWLN